MKLHERRGSYERVPILWNVCILQQWRGLRYLPPLRGVAKGRGKGGVIMTKEEQIKNLETKIANAQEH